ncbi:LysR family regulatory protein [Salmonella enterica subsp. enterica serovar Sanjuan]|uniref:LysR family regulatory protein n=1 Tax=Salmonella enterica subsp. enterica serovar Sanjuan TaxID=1160765 RepID=A0A3S4GBG6_SALET|nr:LysR family regulatory protein [Salmonella enterica subsp. enterica serovar Sanjuan]
MDFLAAMVQAGVGIAILPEPICQRLDKATLRWLPLESDLRWQLGMIWREGVYLSHQRPGMVNPVAKGFG